MTKQEAIEQLENVKIEMSKLEEIINKEKKIRYKPGICDCYWYVTGYGEVIIANFVNNSYDIWRYNQRNCFETREEAEDYKKKLEMKAKWKDLAEESWGGHIRKLADSKHFVSCCIHDQVLSVFKNANYIYEDTYFCTQDSARKAIESIGEENVKKYILEVSE